jgi:5-methylcytosine-specific restriction endonuclease McrA
MSAAQGPAGLSYFPLSLLSWQDAVTAVFKEHLTVVAEYNQVIRSPWTAMRLPSVVAVRDYVKIANRVALTRFNVLLRDRFRCQYCGESFAAKA